MVIKNKLLSQTNKILLAGIILTLMVSFIEFNSAFATDYVLSDQTSCEAAPFLGAWSGNECIIGSVIINPTDSVTINPSTHLIVDESSVFTIGQNFTNNGNFTISGLSIVNVNGISNFTNNNLITILHNGNLWVNSTLTNYGEIVAGDMYIDWNGNFVNEGTVTITDTGSIEVDGILTNNSVFNGFEAVVLIADCPFCQGIITNNNSMYLEQLFNQGVLINSVDKVLTFNATNTDIINQVNGIITNYGEIIIITPNENVSFVNDSEFSNEIGGIVTIIDDGTVNINGSFINENSGLFTNNNTFTINETFLNSALLDNSDTINNQITGTINNQITGTINNTGIINNNCGIVINDGIFTGNSIIEIFCDSDNDSISNLIDIQSDTFSNDFSDIGISGTTSGTITTRGDQILTISEEPNPDGVRISADISGGSTPASFSVCDGASTFSVNAGDEVIITCSSVILNVITGQVIATFVDSNSNTATATIDQNSTLIFKPDTFTIESTSGTSDVTFVNDDGTTVIAAITEDNLIDFDAETFTFTAGQSNTSDIMISIDGETSTLSAATSLSLLSTNRDSFITQGSSSNNEGSNLILRIMSSDKNRPLVGFDQQQILLSSNNKILQSATLRMYITANDNNWGSTGKTIGAYKLNSDWIEGNGWNIDNNISGSGTGVTWSCNVDSNISNNQKDCAVQWDGGNFNLPSTNTIVITNSMINQWIEFDVTADVQSFLSYTDSNYGWLIKKTGDDSLNGSIEFASKESGLHKSELKLVFQE